MKAWHVGVKRKQLSTKNRSRKTYLSLLLSRIHNTLFVKTVENTCRTPFHSYLNAWPALFSCSLLRNSLQYTLGNVGGVITTPVGLSVHLKGITTINNNNNNKNTHALARPQSMDATEQIGLSMSVSFWLCLK